MTSLSNVTILDGVTRIGEYAFAACPKLTVITIPASVKKILLLSWSTTLTPSDAKTSLTWSTSDEKIATVTGKGVVKGVKKGTATITVKTSNGQKASVKVTVK